jgi:UDP-N-acetylmuramoylalanine--D-glutamate ligase
MKVAILGYGSQGRSAYEYWKAKGDEITVSDRDEQLELPADVQAKLGEFYLHHLDNFDLIVRSPSVHLKDIVAANSPEILSKVTTVTNEFLKVCPTKNTIGVTGTKGKGTTSTLIAKMLEADGRRVHLGGNIGIPPLDLLKHDIQPDDWVVLELANFQLIDLQLSPHIAVCLMVAAEHLDWHSDTDEYFIAKSQLFAHQSSDDVAVYYAANETSQRIASVSPGWKVPYMAEPGARVEADNVIIDNQMIVSVSELKLLGKHNWQNVCAAVTAVWKITQNVEAIRSVLTTFSGLEHRLELVGVIDGVRYYDDSFGTTPETAIVAIQAFAEPKVVILGGSDKGASYDELARAIVADNVKKVLLIGEQAARIQAALEQAGFTDFQPGGTSMAEIVRNAREAAPEGGIVLLSTACASFDMFKDYQDRGDQFKVAVQTLV